MNKILNIWLTALVVLIAAIFTISLLTISLILTFIENNPLWLLFNLGYLVITPALLIMWRFIYEMIYNYGGVYNE